MKRLLLLAFILTLSGCSKNQEPPVKSTSAETVPAPFNGRAGLKFAAPEGWIQEQPSSSMRKAQYRLPRAEGDPEDAEMAVFFFQGQGGSVQANIDRWISQFTQPDGAPAAGAAKISKREANGLPLTIVDVSGTYKGGGPMMGGGKPKPSFRMLAAVAETSNGPWFFKLTGPQKTVAKWQESFHTFLNGVKPG